jgi:hypothetical protein
VRGILKALASSQGFQKYRSREEHQNFHILYTIILIPSKLKGSFIDIRESFISKSKAIRVYIRKEEAL